MARTPMTDEQKKEWGAKMKLAREAKITKAVVADPVIKQPVKLSPNSEAAGIQQPSGDNSPKGQFIKQISIEEAESQLDEMDVDEWVKYHYDHGDFNIQKMANVLRESIEDIYNRLHFLGVELPQGTYSDF